MQFIIKKKELLMAISTCCQLSKGGKSLDGIFSFIKISTINGNLFVTGSNGSVSASSRALITSGSDFSICIESTRLVSVVSAFADEKEIIASLDNETTVFTLKNGRSKVNFETRSADDFPEYADKKQLNSMIECKWHLFKKQLTNVKYASGKRGGLSAAATGVNVQSFNGILRLAALDGHRIATTDINIATSEDINATIPIDTVDKLLTAHFNDNEDVRINFYSSFLEILSPTLIFRSNLLSGKYPDYHELVDQERPFNFQIDKNEIIPALTRLNASICGHKSQEICLSFNNNEITISALSNGKLLGVDAISARFFTAPIQQLTVNINYLRDAINQFISNSIFLKISNSSKQACFLYCENESQSAYFMPLKGTR